MTPEAIDALGFIGGIVVASASPFQLYKCWKSQSARDISWYWGFNFVSGLILLFAYGVLLDLTPIWAPLCLELSSTCTMLALKAKLEIFDNRVYSYDVCTQTCSPDEISNSGKDGALKTITVSISSDTPAVINDAQL